MPEQRICTTVYKCAKDHLNGLTFGEKPVGYPDFDRKITLLTDNFFNQAKPKISAWCETCKARVIQIRIGPQPE